MKSILSLIVFFALGLSAAELESPAATEFKPLFNRRDLNGWVPVNIAPETFRAEDGVLITTGQPIGMIRTERMIENFILELEWRRHRVNAVGKSAGISTRSLEISLQGKGTLRHRNLFIRELPEQPVEE